MQSTGVDFIPIVEFKRIESLTSQDKRVLSNSSYFLVSLDSNDYFPYLNENKFVLIDTNKELNKNDYILVADKSNRQEFFQFLNEVQDQWKIKVKSLKNGKTYTKNLSDYTIYGVVIISEKETNPVKLKKQNSPILSQGVIPYISHYEFSQNRVYQQF